jgi:hypothetical protein
MGVRRKRKEAEVIVADFVDKALKWWFKNDPDQWAVAKDKARCIMHIAEGKPTMYNVHCSPVTFASQQLMLVRCFIDGQLDPPTSSALKVNQ